MLNIMMIILYVIIGVFCVVGLIYFFSGWKEDTPVPVKKPHIEQPNEYEARINNELESSGFKSDVDYRYYNMLNRILVLFKVNEENETIAIANYKNPCRIIKFSDIIEYNVVSNGCVTGGIGRAVAGGLIAGGAGAIVGATTANKKLIDYFNIVIYTNHIKDPKVTMSLTNSGVRTDSNEYRNIVEFSDNVGATLKAIIARNQKTANQ